ncbi:MAG TPA: VOC family protein [Ignavibacteria bacterium]|nr:VOC family protein [Ignavibacteria bacterium]
MELTFGRIMILVNDFDEAFEFYERTLMCKKFFDLTENGKRFLHLSFNSSDKTGIRFLKAETEDQISRVGNQSAGLPLFALYTDSLDDFYKHLINENVTIVREPFEKADSKYFHFLDLYGNEIVLVEIKTEVSHQN